MILITGVAGYIGSHLANYFDNKNVKYVGIDNLLYSYKTNISNKKKFYHLDLSDTKKLSYIFKKFKIKTVIHAAACSYVIEGEIKKKFYYENNVVKTTKFINFCEKKKVRNFIFLSSSNVYEEKKNKKSFNENDSLLPKNTYGTTKAIIEKLLLTKNFNNIVILRLFNVVGIFNSNFKVFKFRQKNYQRLIFKIIENVKKNKVTNINYFKKSQKLIFPSRDFISVNNLVIILNKIVKKTYNSKNLFKILNVGSGESISVLKIICELNKIFKKKIKIKYKKISNKELLITKANTLKLKKFIGFKAKNNLRNILLSHDGKFHKSI